MTAPAIPLDENPESACFRKVLPSEADLLRERVFQLEDQLAKTRTKSAHQRRELARLSRRQVDASDGLVNTLLNARAAQRLTSQALTDVQNRCTELLEERRAVSATLELAMAFGREASGILTAAIGAAELKSAMADRALADARSAEERASFAEAAVDLAEEITPNSALEKIVRKLARAESELGAMRRKHDELRGIVGSFGTIGELWVKALSEAAGAENYYTAHIRLADRALALTIQVPDGMTPAQHLQKKDDEIAGLSADLFLLAEGLHADECADIRARALASRSKPYLSMLVRALQRTSEVEAQLDLVKTPPALALSEIDAVAAYMFDAISADATAGSYLMASEDRQIGFGMWTRAEARRLAQAAIDATISAHMNTLNAATLGPDACEDVARSLFVLGGFEGWPHSVSVEMQAEIREMAAAACAAVRARYLATAPVPQTRE